MGFYTERILPRLVDAGCGTEAVEPLRRRTCAGLHGEVLEVGFGSGLNVPFYPSAVTRVRAIEPSDLAWRLATSRVEASSIPVERAGRDGQSLPFTDGTFDTALSTWTLCTIPDPAAALREVRRVVRPGGTLHFVEHGLAPDKAVRTWQRRLEPLQKRVCGGCHLTREPLRLIREAGFTVTSVERFYEEGVPRPFGADCLGVAAVR